MKHILLVITFLFSSGTLPAQNNFETGQNKTNLSIISNIGSDAVSFYKTSIGFIESPLHFDSEDFLMTGIITGATALSFTLDNPIRKEVKTIHSPSMDKITNVGKKLGAGEYGLALSGVLYLSGQFTQESELRKTGVMLAEAIFLNGITTELLKIVIGRSRPYTNEGFDMDPFNMSFNDDENSLPSGHTSTAFTIATVLSERINNTFASIALYSFAGLTAFERIYADRHWFSDTVLGAAIGTIVGLKVVKLNSEYESQCSSVKWNVTPVFSHGSFGVGVVLNF
jgi:hypothetical protein